jgi:HD superfamily phosphodiesterase
MAKMSENSIVKASEKWETNILKYLIELYAENWMPSHDIDHHKRVWKNASEFCTLIPVLLNENESFFEKLIISCYFHDVGLLVNKGEYHGKDSRKICEIFLEMNRKRINFDMEEILFAIENHDEKNDYSKIKNRNHLLEILTVADDLDAFGAIGVYRYIEIYLIRDVPPENIAERVLLNAFQRYENIQIFLSKYDVNKVDYDTKFEILKSLLGKNIYNDESVILVNWINENIVKLKQNPFMIFSELDRKQIPTGRISDFTNKFIFEFQNI